MLIKHNYYHSVDIDKLLRVYAQSVDNTNFHQVSAFLDDLRLFFECGSVSLALWMDGGAPVSALRVEPYWDGYLLSCLETAPQCRRRGYGRTLLCAVMNDTPGIYYAHVDKRNKASLQLHQNLGFEICLDHAVYVDGSVYANSYTLRK